MATVSYPPIDFSPDGVPFLNGTRTKVIEVVLDRLAHHWDAEEIQRQHPHLSLGQIYGALAYYHDHQDVLDAVIQKQLAGVDRVAANCEPSLLQKKLKTVDRE